LSPSQFKNLVQFIKRGTTFLTLLIKLKSTRLKMMAFYINPPTDGTIKIMYDVKLTYSSHLLHKGFNPPWKK
jgi:hypothetical protein